MQNETVLAKEFETFLRRQREPLNALFYQARHYAHALPAETVYRFLTDTLQPVVIAVAPVLEPEERDQLALKLTVLGLDLIGKQLLAPEGPFALIETAWRTLFAAHPQILATGPRRAIASISNALVQLCLHPGARPEVWLKQLNRLGGTCRDLRDFLNLGQILGWQAGLAHYRGGALALIPELPLALQAELLAGEPLAAWRASPWCGQTGKGIQQVRVTGRFAGWGGKLYDPPRLAWEGDILRVTDSQASWSVYADTFGESWFRSPEAATTKTAQTGLGPWRLNASGQVRRGKQTAKFAELAGFQQAAGCSHTLAVGLSESFQIVLLTKVNRTI